MIQLFRRRIRPGFYYCRGIGEWAGLKLYLRVLESGDGVLVINAFRVVYLNQTATAHVKLMMEGKGMEEAVKELRRIFKIGREKAIEDYKRVLYTINTIASAAEDICPFSYVGVERVEPLSKELPTPLRLDLALTYRCNNHCVHCYSGTATVSRELSTEDWVRVIDRAYDLGIPQILYTGGEPTIREDLVDIVTHAEATGLVTGLVTNGRKLKDFNYVQQLVAAGLDYAQVTLESHQPEIHDGITQVSGSWNETVAGIQNLLKTPIYTSINMTLNRQNLQYALESVDFLYELGVRRFSCNGLIYAGKGLRVASTFAVDEKELIPTLKQIRDHAREYGMQFTWYTPTHYCVLNPVALGLGIKCCSAARITLCVEPDGDVIPCQSFFENVGNILTDDWGAIWNHPICNSLRGREYAPVKCRGCPELTVCGAGCPLELKAKRVLCGECYES
ncbi:MAG: pyrroloquinoline quinone biosynthesis protein PqqE [Candidatus Bathyarchaeota archaeon BA1]|nr:MAG: pyrroloquinoline quinone biosynthesis protein PqqE [Candidatus Bathyarchaeota archaeon BA1]